MRLGGKRRDVLNIADDDTRPGVPHLRPVEDVAEFEVAPGRVYKARWPIFLPTLAIAAICGGALFFLYEEGRLGGALARLFLIVLTVGVPILAAHAFLRYQTIRLQVVPHGIRYHPGWPKDLPVELPFELIERVRAKHGLIGYLAGTGTLVIDLTTGGRIAIADLARPGPARSDIRKAMAEDDEN